MTAAITVEPPDATLAANVPVPKTYAALLTGPPYQSLPSRQAKPQANSIGPVQTRQEAVQTTING